MGAYLRQGFERLQKTYPSIGDVRGVGLYVGVELVKPDGGKTPDTAEALRIVNGLRQRCILISTCGPAGNVLKIRPPLQFSTEHCDLLLNTTEELLARGITLPCAARGTEWR